MIELAHTLLPNLPDKLLWVYGVFYVVETIAFFVLLLCPFFLILRPGQRRK